MQYLKPKNLRQGLILIVIVALMPVAIVSIWQGLSSRDNTHTLVANKLNATAKAVAEEQRAPFIIAQHLLSTITANSDVRDMTPRCAEVLKAVGQNYRPIVNFVRSDASGKVRCSVLPFRSSASLASEKWWQQGIISNGMTITAPVLGTISKRDVLILMLPLRNSAGQQYGAVSTGIDIAYLNEVTKNVSKNYDGSLAIVTSQGQTLRGSGEKLPFLSSTKLARQGIGTAKTADGDTWLYATAPIYGPNLHVVYAQRQAPLFATANAQTRASIFLPIGSILLASLAIWFGTHRLVVSWLRDLGRVVGGFAKGDFKGDPERFEKAPAEIAELSSGLHSMAKDIDEQNSELKQALEANIDLTREVHHRVKNNLQIITSLLILQSSRVQEPDAQQVLGQTRTRISALALIHRLLYQQDPDNESERGKVAIANLMEELCVQLRAANRSMPGITLRCSSSAHSISADQAVPLALFAVEALTNAYRHAFTNARSGKISLNFWQADGDGVLTVEDDGEGFEANDDIGQMGLELMNAFASQLSGDVEIESEIDSGSRVTLTFPASNILHA